MRVLWPTHNLGPAGPSLYMLILVYLARAALCPLVDPRAVFGGNVSVMAYLKDDVPELDVHSTNISGCAAAHWAGATGNVATCKWLFANGFDLGVTNHANHGLVNSAAYKGEGL